MEEKIKTRIKELKEELEKLQIQELMFRSVIGELENLLREESKDST